jgi:hypothetical protein
MPVRSLITVFIPTPLIFRYHLRLNIFFQKRAVKTGWGGWSNASPLTTSSVDISCKDDLTDHSPPRCLLHALLAFAVYICIYL